MIKRALRYLALWVGIVLAYGAGCVATGTVPSPLVGVIFGWAVTISMVAVFVMRGSLR